MTKHEELCQLALDRRGYIVICNRYKLSIGEKTTTYPREDLHKDAVELVVVAETDKADMDKQQELWGHPVLNMDQIASVRYYRTTAEIMLCNCCRTPVETEQLLCSACLSIALAEQSRLTCIFEGMLQAGVCRKLANMAIITYLDIRN